MRRTRAAAPPRRSASRRPASATSLMRQVVTGARGGKAAASHVKTPMSVRHGCGDSRHFVPSRFRRSRSPSLRSVLRSRCADAPHRAPCRSRTIPTVSLPTFRPGPVASRRAPRRRHRRRVPALHRAQDSMKEELQLPGQAARIHSRLFAKRLFDGAMKRVKKKPSCRKRCLRCPGASPGALPQEIRQVFDNRIPVSLPTFAWPEIAKDDLMQAPSSTGSSRTSAKSLSWRWISPGRTTGMDGCGGGLKVP